MLEAQQVPKLLLAQEIATRSSHISGGSLLYGQKEVCREAPCTY